MVDNGSTDGSVDGWAARHPDVRLVQTGANLGFAGGVNRGLADLDDVDAVALVNSDAFVDPGWLGPAGRRARRRRRASAPPARRSSSPTGSRTAGP